MRTFISKEKGRAQLVSHVYDITYGVVKEDDVLVVLDDSIVRGTTLKESILKILARTSPKKIVICSTAPQIRYPDCYGIDMSELGKFIAFRAAESLRRKRGEETILKEVYEACKAELEKPLEERQNAAKGIYEGLSVEEISAEVASLVTPENINWDGEIEVVFITIDDLHKAIGEKTGDWYFSGDYPTPGGTTVANIAYINHFEGKDGRSYGQPS